jgi:hypothetical protein
MNSIYSHEISYCRHRLRVILCLRFDRWLHAQWTKLVANTLVPLIVNVNGAVVSYGNNSLLVSCLILVEHSEWNASIIDQNFTWLVVCPCLILVQRSLLAIDQANQWEVSSTIEQSSFDIRNMSTRDTCQTMRLHSITCTAVVCLFCVQSRLWPGRTCRTSLSLGRLLSSNGKHICAENMSDRIDTSRHWPINLFIDRTWRMLNVIDQCQHLQKKHRCSYSSDRSVLSCVCVCVVFLWQVTSFTIVFYRWWRSVISTQWFLSILLHLVEQDCRTFSLILC